MNSNCECPNEGTRSRTTRNLSDWTGRRKYISLHLHTYLFLQYRDRQHIINRIRKYKLWIEDKCILSGYAQHLVGSKLSLALDTFLKIPYDTKDVQRKLFKKDQIQNLDRLGSVGRHKRGRYGMGHIGLVFLVVGGGYPRICFEYVLKLTTKWCILRHYIGIISTSNNSVTTWIT